MKNRLFKKKSDQVELKNNIEFAVKIKSIDESGKFRAIANKFLVRDNAADITRMGTFTDSIRYHQQKGTMPKLLSQHNHNSLPIGVIENWYESEEEGGLIIEGRFDTSAPEYMMLKDGRLDSFSIGYKVLEEEWDDDAKANWLKKVHVVEVSVVTLPCNDESILLDIKSDSGSDDGLDGLTLDDVLLAIAEGTLMGLESKKYESEPENDGDQEEEEDSIYANLIDPSVMAEQNLAKSLGDSDINDVIQDMVDNEYSWIDDSMLKKSDENDLSEFDWTSML